MFPTYAGSGTLINALLKRPSSRDGNDHGIVSLLNKELLQAGSLNPQSWYGFKMCLLNELNECMNE